MKSPMMLWSTVLKELGTWCGTSTALDLKKAQSRFEHEGLSFLTITLPSFGKDLEKGLELGKVDLDHYAGFQRRGGLPLFLGGFLDRVFDRSSGLLLDDPDVDSIFAIRQLTLMFGKILVPCSDARIAGAIDGFVKCEQEVRMSDSATSDQQYADLARMSSLLFREVFTAVDRDVYAGDILPKHGPGTTAEKLLGNKKLQQVTWPARLEKVFPYLENALPNARYHSRLDDVHFLEPGQELPVRVVTVPKTLKTPRIIAIEPVAMQYMQQGLMEKFVKYLETDKTVSGMIGFTDQGPNQVMAREGSLNPPKGGLATLDLSEASDRVSNQHVRTMLQRWPHLFEAVDATRSRKADVPRYGVLRLAKFASMGSALCFPMEAMVFLTIIFLGIEQELSRPLSRKDVKSFSGRVRVYGDDIIVPVEYVSSVIASLESFGFKVNGSKSFWNGKFRESCGKEYYDGHDVSIVRIRRELSTSRKNVPESIISTVSLRNQFYELGLWMTAKMMDERYVLPSLGGHFPIVQSSSPAQGRVSVLPYESEKEHPTLHTPLVKAYVVTPKIPLNSVSEEFALLKGFLKRSDEPFADRDHLERSGRPDAVNLKLRWATPY